MLMHAANDANPEITHLILSNVRSKSGALGLVASALAVSPSTHHFAPRPTVGLEGDGLVTPGGPSVSATPSKAHSSGHSHTRGHSGTHSTLPNGTGGWPSLTTGSTTTTGRPGSGRAVAEGLEGGGEETEEFVTVSRHASSSGSTAGVGGAAPAGGSALVDTNLPGSVTAVPGSVDTSQRGPKAEGSGGHRESGTNVDPSSGMATIRSAGVVGSGRFAGGGGSGRHSGLVVADRNSSNNSSAAAALSAALATGGVVGGGPLASSQGRSMIAAAAAVSGTGGGARGLAGGANSRSRVSWNTREGDAPGLSGSGKLGSKRGSGISGTAVPEEDGAEHSDDSETKWVLFEGRSHAT